MLGSNFSIIGSHVGTISSPFSPGKSRTRTSTHVTEGSLHHHQSLCQHLSTGYFWYISPTLLLLCGPIRSVWNCEIDRGYLMTGSETTRTRSARIVRPLWHCGMNITRSVEVHSAGSHRTPKTEERCESNDDSWTNVGHTRRS